MKVTIDGSGNITAEGDSLAGAGVITFPKNKSDFPDFPTGYTVTGSSPNRKLVSPNHQTVAVEESAGQASSGVAGGGGYVQIAAADTPAALIPENALIATGSNDEVLINSALASGYPVTLLPGNFYIGSPIIHTLTGGRLVGMGPEQTFIHPSSTSIDAIRMGAQLGTAGATQTSYQFLGDLKVVYTRGTVTGTALKVVDARDFIVRNISCDGGADGIYLENASVFKLDCVNAVFFTNNGIRLNDKSTSSTTVTIGEFDRCKLSCDNDSTTALLFDGDVNGLPMNRLHFSACRFGNDAAKASTVGVKFKVGSRSTVFTACEMRQVVTGLDFTSNVDHRSEVLLNGVSFNGVSGGTAMVDALKISQNNNEELHLSFDGCQFDTITNAFNVATMRFVRLKFGNNHYTNVGNVFNLQTAGVNTDAWVHGEQYGSSITNWATGSGTLRHRTPTTFPMPAVGFRDAFTPYQSAEGRFVGGLSDQATSGSGIVRSRLVWLQKGDKVSNITFTTGATAAGTPTAGFVALYDDSATPALMAQSADFSTTARAANTAYTVALQTPQTIVRNGWYWLGISFTASTVPSLYSYDLKNNTIASGIVTGQPSVCQSHGSSTGGTAPATITGGTAQNKVPYLVAS